MLLLCLFITLSRGISNLVFYAQSTIMVISGQCCGVSALQISIIIINVHNTTLLKTFYTKVYAYMTVYTVESRSTDQLDCFTDY